MRGHCGGQHEPQDSGYVGGGGGGARDQLQNGQDHGEGDADEEAAGARCRIGEARAGVRSVFRPVRVTAVGGERDETWGGAAGCRSGAWRGAGGQTK
jgi:hypothetical protein